eukprot:CAMPEP_0172551248 /NCGR_PEP_ID=MMETSP1067-20121228/37102_1 /TAXON_ID=265564 ORGANISM="Thalassiosira punctigera, Strain Tpunct2005C2" /NCGR_SAMPLE_ID=MMETSP1067 /ASSEMBLY_ACC=CAM_ASM_000444 /LENGTH=370 /DNA_ID=CAMNT_0013339009 /DNA_START=16 /DNA_END=1128 /DNA_ORIENTATION=-
MAKSTSSRCLKPLPAALCAIAAVAILSSAGAFSPSPKNTRQSTSNLSAAAAAATIAPPSYSVLFGLSLKRSVQEAKPLFSVPSIFNPSDSRPVVLFDGKCNLCNAGVQLILDADRASSDPRGNLRVAALQSRVGRVLLERLPPDQRKTVLSMRDGEGDKTYKSIVVAGEHRTWLNSAACIRIGKELKGPLRYLALLASIIPSFIRDPLYKLLSRYRKKLFGEAPECRLWDDNWDTRFVNDAMFGGRSGEIDPFADPNVPQEEEDFDDDDENVEEAPPGSPLLNVGDKARVVSSQPILHSSVEGSEGSGEVCSVGLVGTVTRVFERKAHQKNVVVKFELEGGADGNAPIEGEEKIAISFEAHFFPGQLRKE